MAYDQLKYLGFGVGYKKVYSWAQFQTYFKQVLKRF
jgi:hypothetical protein